MTAPRRKVFAWIGIAWGAFILVAGAGRAMGGGLEAGAYGVGQLLSLAFGALMLFAGIRALTMPPAQPSSSSIEDFAARYTSAWCSGSAARVASFFAKHGSLTINGGAPAVGRTAIEAAAQGFMTAFPNMVVKMDSVDVDVDDDGAATYHWTLIGTNTGPGGTGRPVRISGREEWVLGADGLILDSQGHFDQADYQRQLGF